MPSNHNHKCRLKRGNMKSFQKLFTTCAIGSLLAFSINCADALTLTDVPSGYWAAGAVVQAVQNGWLAPKGDKFYPSEPVTRAEFANAVYNVIQRMPAAQADGFNDVTYQSQYGKSILTLQQLQIVFGYPDGNFKPGATMKRSEASSVIANIIKSDFWDKSVLNKFKDKDDVPQWATPSYINNVVNNVYVNYPKEDVLLPNEYLTRAETAVLMAKLKYAIDQYKVSYLPEEELENTADVGFEEEERVVPVFVGTNTLGEFKHSYKNTVNLYDSKKVIEAGNIVPVRSLQKLNAKTVKEGDILTYVSPKDVYSLEGTKLYNQGTKFIGYVDRTENSYWFKRQHKAYIVFNKAILGDGTEFPIAGVLYSTYKGDVVLEKNKNSRKVENDAKKQYSKRDAAIKFTDKLVPVIKYDEKAKDNLFMLITGDMIIPESSSL